MPFTPHRTSSKMTIAGGRLATVVSSEVLPIVYTGSIEISSPALNFILSKETLVRTCNPATIDPPLYSPESSSPSGLLYWVITSTTSDTGRE